jgi:hypothetical protein
MQPQEPDKERVAVTEQFSSRKFCLHVLFDYTGLGRFFRVVNGINSRARKKLRFVENEFL